jgi:hypothetical protein
MNKWLKRGVNFSLFLIAFNTLEHFCHQKTKGFSLQRIQFHTAPVQFATPDPAISHLLNQPYRYFGNGNQCYAFISEDGQTILKFFKYVDNAPPAWIAKVPFLNKFKPFSLKRISKISWKRDRDFQGYQLAYDRFREETGLLALHLSPTENTYPTITLYDKLGIIHSLDLNNTPFILQKRATLIYEQFLTWLQAGDIDKVRHGIDHLISLCAKRISKEIFDDDVHFYSNFGFIGEIPIQIDPGHFISGLSPASELETLTLELKEWFAKNYPPLVSYVEASALSH